MIHIVMCLPCSKQERIKLLHLSNMASRFFPRTEARRSLVIRNEVDEEFWLLSAAHYDRYMATSDLFVDGSRSELIG